MIERGSIIVVALKGTYGKPRPALVVQNNQTIPAFDSVTVCLLTSDHDGPNPLRIPIGPDVSNGLQLPSFIQVDKVQTVSKSKARGPIGRITNELMRQVELALAFHLNLYALAKSTE